MEELTAMPRGVVGKNALIRGVTRIIRVGCIVAGVASQTVVLEAWRL